MAIINFQILLYSLSMLFCILFPQTTSVTFNLTTSDFADQSKSTEQLKLELFLKAERSNDGLQITSDKRTDNMQAQAGKVIYTEPLHLWDKSTRNVTDFSTHFVFVINSVGISNFADGLTFFLAPNGSDCSVGGAMGLPFNTSTKTPTSQFVAVEFDTFGNIDKWDGWDPVSIGRNPHVGIDVNSLTSNVTARWYCNITNGTENEAWISYDSTSHNLSVVFIGSYKNSRVEGSLNYTVDLSLYLPQWVTFGFSAATGANFQMNSVKSWDFTSTDLDTIETTIPGPATNTSVPVKPGSKKFSTGAVVGLAVGSAILVGGSFVLAGFYLRRRRGPKEEEELEFEMAMENEFEAGSGPKKFSYSQLSRATNNFEEGQMLGEGGFGGVYRGFSRELNSYVAVKRISKGSKQGIKEYATEVTIISRLRHRNLVQLIGWCHEKKQLLLVYEFMENASLDFHLFKGKSLLSWGTRYKIAQGLASALLYLHEEWEQCVLHRDIKSSNVMLDSNFNTKLGDFGLARFVDHEKAPQTTAVAGTMGYLAPEYVVTGKASKESDTYSFGIVLLEIACGRKPHDMKVPESQMRLVEWVWDLYGMGRLLEAVDPKLGSDFDEQETERLMTVGLWCAHPDHNFRPKIRQAIHVLNLEAPLPILPPKLPMLSFFPPLNTSTTSFDTSQNQYSSSTYNADSSLLTSSSTASYSSISVPHRE